MGDIIPVEITVYEDRTFTFITKTPPAAVLIKKVGKFKKGSDSSLLKKIGTITKDQLREIAETKLPDLNTNDVKQAMRTITGTASHMGVEIKD